MLKFFRRIKWQFRYAGSYPGKVQIFNPDSLETDFFNTLT